MGPDERAIREVHSTWIDAVNAGDLVCLLSLMADDVVFLNPGQAPFGRDGFSPGFSAAHQQARIKCISELEDVVVVGEVAYTLSRDSLSVTPRAGGEAMQLAGQATRLDRRIRLCFGRIVSRLDATRAPEEGGTSLRSSLVRGCTDGPTPVMSLLADRQPKNPPESARDRLRCGRE